MNTLVIKKEDLRYNIKQIKDFTEKLGKDDNGNFIKIIAIIEENGYGLGLIEYVKFLIENGISFFAVKTIQEAINLRKEGIKQDILCLSQTAVKQDIEKLVENNIIITLGSKNDIKVADEVAKEQKKKIKAHIKIDTSLGIYGFAYNNRDEMIEELKTMKNIEIKGTYSTFNRNSKNSDKNIKTQFQRFIDVIEILKLNDIQTGILHICDQEEFFRYSMMNLNAIRIDKAFLGKISQNSENFLKLRNPVTLETKITEIKNIPKGTYLGNSKTKKEMTIAIIPYMCSNEITQKYILLNKNKCKIIGNIENNIICEIGKNDIKIGQKVILPIDSSNVNQNVRREYK